MKFGIMVNRKMIDRHSADPYGPLFSYLREMANNRFILGGGIGYSPDEFENCGWSFRTRTKRLEDCIEVPRLAMTGQQFSYKGTHFDINDVMVQPAAARGEIPPIWVGR